MGPDAYNSLDHPNSSPVRSRIAARLSAHYSIAFTGPGWGLLKMCGGKHVVARRDVALVLVLDTSARRDELTAHSLDRVT